MKDEVKLKPWTQWANAVEKRIFLVVEVPADQSGKVMIMEVKEYPEGEDRLFITMPYSDWVTLTEETKKLILYTPKL